MSRELITRIVLRGVADPSVQRAFATASRHSDSYIGKLQKIGEFATKAFKVVATAALTGGALASKAAIDYESAFAGVMKTVEETGTTTYEDLSEGIRQLAKETPATASEIAAVAEAAGQLGIKADDILKFSKVMIDLGETTNLSSDEAATAIAKMFNITGTSMDDVDRFGSTLVHLGNNAATTEADILNMATRIASSATLVGMSESEMLALATSLSSVGLEAEGGGTAISTVMSRIDKDVAMNSETLSTWAATAGMSVSEFSSLWKNDAYGAMQKIVSGMGNFRDEGGNLNILLEEMGINNIRQTDTMKRLANASELMSEMTGLATTAWSENSALTNEANVRYATMASKLQVLKNKFYDLGIEVGNKLMPYLEKFVDKLSNIDFDAVAEKIGGAIDWIAVHAKTLGLVASIIGGLFVGIKIAGFIKGIISAIQIISALVKAFGFMKVILATLGGPITIIIAVVSALVAGFIYLWNTSEGFRNFFINMWNGIKSVVSAVGNWLKNFFTVTIPNAFNAVINFIKGNWQGLLLFIVNPFAGAFKLLYDNCEGFRNTVKNVVNAVVTFFQQLPYKIGYAIGFVIGKIVLFGQKLWSFATTTVPQFIGKVVNWFIQLPGKIWTWLVNTIQKVIAWGSRMIALGKQKAVQFVNAAVNFIKTLPGKIWTWLVNAAQKVVAWGAQLVAKGKAAATQLMNSIVNTVKQIPSKLLSIGRNIVEGLWNGIQNAKSWLIGKIKSFASGVVDGFKSALGINSPSVIMMKLAKFIPQGVGVGVVKNAKYAVNAIKGMGSKMTAAASKISPTIGGVSSRLPKFGTGGTVTNPQAAIIGDKPETIVPHGNTARNRALLSEAARGVGASSGGGNIINFTFAPVINGGNAESIREMLLDEEEAFERRMEEFFAKNRRLAYGI